MQTEYATDSTTRCTKSSKSARSTEQEETQQRAAELFEATARILTPPPRLTVSEWADAKRRLSRESSAEPGQWRTDRAPYQRGIMDAMSDSAVREIWAQKSAQVG